MSDTTGTPAPARRGFRMPDEIGVIVALVVMMVFIGVARPRFLNPLNLLTLLGHTTFLGMLAVGMVFLLAIREIDLSVGWMFNLSAVVTALLISVLQRKRELGLLLAVGATPAQVLRSVLAEAMLMGMFGTLIGLLIGLPMVWYVLRLVLVEESGFILPILIPWKQTAIIAAVSISTATIAGLLPAIRAIQITSRFPAVHGAPVSRNSFARRMPTARGSICVAHAPGMMPSVTSVSASRACVAP